MHQVASKEVSRSSVLLSVRMKTKNGSPLLPEEAWALLVNHFSKHPVVEIESARIYPDIDKPE